MTYDICIYIYMCIYIYYIYTHAFLSIWIRSQFEPISCSARFFRRRPRDSFRWKSWIHATRSSAVFDGPAAMIGIFELPRFNPVDPCMVLKWKVSLEHGTRTVTFVSCWLIMWFWYILIIYALLYRIISSISAAGKDTWCEKGKNCVNRCWAVAGGRSWSMGRWLPKNFLSTPHHEYHHSFVIKKSSLILSSPSGWWFQFFFIFTPIWGRLPIWLIFFKWVVQPPTSHAYPYSSCYLRHPRAQPKCEMWSKVVQRWG